MNAFQTSNLELWQRRSYVAILIFQSSVVTDDYIAFAIKEIQVFNQDLVPLKHDVCGSVTFMLLMFHK